MSAPSSRTVNVFCQSWPNPWRGPDTRLPDTASSFAPATPAADSRSTGRAQLAASRLTGSVVIGSVVGASMSASSSAGGGRHGGRFVVGDLDRLVEAGQREDLAVVL